MELGSRKRDNTPAVQILQPDRHALEADGPRAQLVVGTMAPCKSFPMLWARQLSQVARKEVQSCAALQMQSQLLLLMQPLKQAADLS